MSQIVKPINPVLKGGPLTAGLVFDAAFAERYGNTVKSTINGYVGTITNSTNTWSNSALGPGVALDGSNDFITFPSSPPTESAQTNMTVECWFVPTSISLAQFMWIFDKWTFTAGNFRSWGLRMQFLTPNTTLEFLSANAGTDATSSSVTFNINSRLNTLIHAVATLDGANTKVSLYVDGVLVNSATNALFNITTASVQPVLIGGADAGTNSPGPIKVYGARIWNRTLTPVEVNTLYKNPFAIYKKPSQDFFLNALAAGGLTAAQKAGFFFF